MTATERKVSHVLKILSNEAVRNELMQEISAMATECLKGVAERYISTTMQLYILTR